MSYLLALLLSVIACAMVVAISLLQRNTEHLTHGREPNASFSLVPMVPLFQLMALGATWALERLSPDLAMVVMLVGFSVLAAIWGVAYLRAKAAYACALVESQKRLK